MLIESISLFGALTNTAILVFMTGVFETDNKYYKLIIFILIEHFILMVMFSLKFFVSDMPENVVKARIWGRRIINERIFNQPTDIDEQRELRNLHFKPPKSQVQQNFKAEEIFSKNE